MYNSLCIPSVKTKFTTKDDTLFKIIKDADKFSEALVVAKSLALTILVNLHKYKGHSSTNKTFSLIQGVSCHKLPIA